MVNVCLGQGLHKYWKDCTVLYYFNHFSVTNQDMGRVRRQRRCRPQRRWRKNLTNLNTGSNWNPTVSRVEKTPLPTWELTASRLRLTALWTVTVRFYKKPLTTYIVIVLKYQHIHVCMLLNNIFLPGDPTKSPSCELGGPGSLKSERLSSDSNDILDPQTGLRGPTNNLQVR